MKDFCSKIIFTLLLMSSGIFAAIRTCQFTTVQGPILCDQHIGRVPDCGTSCLDLTGKFALVIGGSKGIGLATANRLSAAGAQVITTSRHPQDYSGQPFLSPVCLDTRSQTSVNDFFGAVILPLGKTIDILVLCAGIPFYGPMSATSGDDMEIHFNTNVFGYQRVMFAAFSEFEVMSNNGRVIMLGSFSGEAPIETTYGVGKHAIQYLAEAWNVERLILNQLGTPGNQSTFTYLEPTGVKTNFGVNEWCYPAALGRCHPLVLATRSSLQFIQTDIGINATDVAEAIYRIAASPTPPHAGYFVDCCPTQTYPGPAGTSLTVPQVLQLTHCDPVDQIDAGTANALVAVAQIAPPLPCQPLVLFTACATGIESCAGGT